MLPPEKHRNIDMIFWIAAIVIAIISIILLLLPLLRPVKPLVSRSAYDVQIYKDQLKEVETDLARGTLSDEEAKSSRTEVSRRLLAAAEAEASETLSDNAPKAVSRILAGLVALVLVGGSVGVYYKVGVPGLPDLPLQQRLADRPSQAEGEKAAQDRAATVQSDAQQPDPRQLELVQQLQDILKNPPADMTLERRLVGQRMLADNLALLGRYVEARQAQDVVMDLLGKNATADDYAASAEIMIVAADFYVSPEADAALATALQLDSSNPRARYYVGIAFLQNGQAATTYDVWNQLLQEGPADAPWIAIIQGQIGAVAAEAGIEMPTATAAAPSATSPGPSAADVQAAGQMSAADRTDMIKSMVARLADRLATEGGPAEDWAKLINAYGVLGDTESAAAKWQEAQDVFANDVAGFATVKQAAQSAGVAGQ